MYSVKKQTPIAPPPRVRAHTHAHTRNSIHRIYILSDRFLNQALDQNTSNMTHNITPYKRMDGKYITITVGIRGAIHKHSIKKLFFFFETEDQPSQHQNDSIKKLTNLNIPKSNVETLVKTHTPKRHQVPHILSPKQKKTRQQQNAHPNSE